MLITVKKKFGGDRFNSSENDEKNKALNKNILKKAKEIMGLVI